MKKILVVSHERSGTHFLINAIAINFGFDNRWIDIHCKDHMDPDDSYKESYKNDIKAFFESQYQVQTNQIYKAHHQFGYYEDYFDQILEHFNIFYIHRDGRDTLASCYHYFNTAPVKAFPKCKTIEEFLFKTPPYRYPYDGAYSYIKSENIIEHWVKHIETWKPIFDRITIISFGDLKNEFGTTIDKISTTLGKESPERVTVPPVKMRSINPGKGIEGGWKNVMSEEIAARLMEDKTAV